MNYLCQVCTANCDAYGNPGAVVDPLAKTMTITCIGCRLKVCMERSRMREQHAAPVSVPRKYNARLAGKLPYKDE